MANYATLKAAIQQVVKTNGNNEITGALLQQSLLAMINSLGVGYQYAGIATPETDPGTPDQNVFYIASTAGIYANFGSLVLADGEISILKYNGTWTKDIFGAASLAFAKKILDDVNEIIYGNLLTFTLQLVQGQAIPMNQYNESLYLESGKIYRIAFSKIRTNGTTFNIFLRDNLDNPVSFKGSVAVSNLDAQTASTFLNVAQSWTECYIKPQSDVHILHIYATSSAINENKILDVSVFNYPNESIETRIENLEENAGTVADGAVTTPKIADGAVTHEKLAENIGIADEIVEETQHVSKNLVNQQDSGVPGIANSGFVPYPMTNQNGYINTSSAGAVTTGFVPVEPGKSYYFHALNDGGECRSYLFFDSNHAAITTSWPGYSYTGYDNVVAPANAAYMRATFVQRTNLHYQISEGQEYEYEDYFTPYSDVQLKDNVVTNNAIADGAISPEKLTDKLAGKIMCKIGRFNGNANLSGGQTLKLESVHIGKNNFVCCELDGAISGFEIGVGYSDLSTYGYRDYAALWLTVDSTNITQYRCYNAAPVQRSQAPHGLTLTQAMKAELFIGSSDSYFKLYDNLGNVFSMPIENDGSGIAFVTNDGQNSISAKLVNFPMDITKPIWVFGDSYMSFTSATRWPYYFKEKGYINWLSNNQPGLAPQTGWQELNNLLSLGYTPKTIVWLLGMNGDTQESQVGGEYVINTYQKTYIDNVVKLCSDKGIDLILNIVPTVPQRQKTGFGNYIKSLGVRYVDTAKAVGANSSGVWTTGLLSSDNVHPTTAGSIVIASQVAVDCPELTMSE